MSSFMRLSLIIVPLILLVSLTSHQAGSGQKPPAQSSSGATAVDAAPASKQPARSDRDDFTSLLEEQLEPKDTTGTVLGVHVSQATPALRAHLSLPPQFGLLIEHVVPQSAAADSKLKRFDVLHQFDDQLLVNEEQLTALVRMHKPDDKVTVTIFREGKSMKVDVVLKTGPITEKPVEQLKVVGWHESELTNHATSAKFANCRACHGPIEPWHGRK